METNKVVARFKDGSIMKGKTNDFFPNKTSFHLETLNGETQQIEVEQLKAFFLVKDFEGNKNYDEDYQDEISGTGRKIMVKFSITDEELFPIVFGVSANRAAVIWRPCGPDRLDAPGNRRSKTLAQ